MKVWEREIILDPRRLSYRAAVLPGELCRVIGGRSYPAIEMKNNGKTKFVKIEETDICLFIGYFNENDNMIDEEIVLLNKKY